VEALEGNFGALEGPNLEKVTGSGRIRIRIKVIHGSATLNFSEENVHAKFYGKLGILISRSFYIREITSAKFLRFNEL
jgi:hypothetical protein